jgi:ATP-dependent RNA helicase SUPV3L1/SUV3
VRRVPTGLERLSIPQIKQIAGRAGRYRAANHDSKKLGAGSSVKQESNVGFVTSLEDVDLPYIQEALRVEPQPLLTAGILPPDDIVRRFASYFPTATPFAYILQRLHAISEVNPRYFLCNINEQCATSEVIGNVDNLGVSDRLIFMASPAPTRDPGVSVFVEALARCVAEQKSGALLDIREFDLEILDQPVSSDREYLRTLESVHRAIVLYLWLSYRCGGIFTDRTLATHVKSLVEERMDRALTQFSANRKLRKQSSLERQMALLRQAEQRDRVFNDKTASQPSGNQLNDATVYPAGQTIVYDSAGISTAIP